MSNALMPDDRNKFLTSQTSNRLAVRASLVRRGLQEIVDLENASTVLESPAIDYSRLSIVITVNTGWTVRADAFPGKTYLMFACDIENKNDSEQRIGKEMAICQRSKSNGEISYVGDAILLGVSPEPALAPQSATSLDLELEMDSLKDSSADSLGFVLCDRCDLLGYDYTSRTAILIVPNRREVPKRSR